MLRANIIGNWKYYLKQWEIEQNCQRLLQEWECHAIVIKAYGHKAFKKMYGLKAYGSERVKDFDYF